MKGHDYWLRATVRGYINEPSFSIVYHLIYSYFIHYSYMDYFVIFQV
jgi:hypothetical protein